MLTHSLYFSLSVCLSICLSVLFLHFFKEGWVVLFLLFLVYVCVCVCVCVCVRGGALGLFLFLFVFFSIQSDQIFFEKIILCSLHFFSIFFSQNYFHLYFVQTQESVGKFFDKRGKNTTSNKRRKKINKQIDTLHYSR